MRGNGKMKRENYKKQSSKKVNKQTNKQKERNILTTRKLEMFLWFIDIYRYI